MSPARVASVAAGEAIRDVLDHGRAGILGKESSRANRRNMCGRRPHCGIESGLSGLPVVDFGGFLGVGSRRSQLHGMPLRFPGQWHKVDRVTLEWTRDQVVREAPEYRDDKPVVMLEAASN